MDKLSPEAKLMSAIFGYDVTDERLEELVDGRSLAGALSDALDSIARGRTGRRSTVFLEHYKRVMVLRFGLADGRSRPLQEVGREFGVTGERIRQIEGKTLRLLRHPTRAKTLQRYIK